MARKAGDARVRFVGDTVLGLVEPGGWGGAEQLLQALHLFGGQEAVKDLVIVGKGNFLAARDIAQLFVVGQEQGWRKSGQVGVRDVEVHVHALVLRVGGGPDL